MTEPTAGQGWRPPPLLPPVVVQYTTTDPRDRAMRVRLRMPWIGAGLVFAFTLLMGCVLVSDHHDELKLARRSTHVQGRIEPTWTHGSRIPVTYVDPFSGHTLRGLVSDPESSASPHRI